MSSCYFFRVNNQTNIQELKEKMNVSMHKAHPKLDYEELVRINMTNQDFLNKSQNIFLLAREAVQFLSQSCAGSCEKWKCIVFNNKETNEKVIIYTSGRTYPLYAAYINDNIRGY